MLNCDFQEMSKLVRDRLTKTRTLETKEAMVKRRGFAL